LVELRGLVELKCLLRLTEPVGLSIKVDRAS
jgi:hypothetical protein